MKTTSQKILLYCTFLVFALFAITLFSKLTKTPDTSKESTASETHVPQKFLSKDGRLSIMLPDDTWTLLKEKGDVIQLKSGDNLISLLRVSGSDLKKLQIPTTQAELDTMLKDNTSKAKFTVTSFEDLSTDSSRIYKSTIHCTDKEPVATYGASYGIYTDAYAYVATGTVKADDKAALAAILASLESLQIL